MRILRVISTLDPRGGGPVEGLTRSAAVIDTFGHQTEVACTDPPDAPWLKDLPFQAHALGPGTRPFSFSRRLVPFIRARRSDYDVAVVHGLWNYGSIGAWLGLRGGPTPYVVFTHGMMDPWFKREYPLKHAAKQAYWLVAQGRVLTDAHAVLFTTEEERRLARESFFGFGKYREEVVAYGAAAPPEDAESQVASFRATVPEVQGRRFLLYLSRIHPKKGCDLLVSAFADIAAEHPDLHLVMAGPDETGWRPELETRTAQAGIAGRIHWPGMLRGDAKWGAMRAAEAFILPSHQENFGIAVAEAMACGRPVLITDKVNIWREVEACGAGLVAPDDLAGTVSLLRRFLSLDAAQKAVMGEAARRGFEQSFDVRSAATSLLDVLARAVAAKAGSPRLQPEDAMSRRSR